MSDTERTLLALHGPDEAIAAGGSETAHMVPGVGYRGVLLLPPLPAAEGDVSLYEAAPPPGEFVCLMVHDGVDVAMVRLDLPTLRQLAEQALVLCRRHRMAP